MDKQRDIWDKVEAIIKIVSIFVLIYTTYKGSEKIATSLEKGKLVQSLIADLSSRESSIRQDVALIALNRSVEKDDTLLVAEIAERLFEDVKDSGVLLGRTAYKILKERRPAYAEQVKQNSQKNLSDSTNRSKNISAADTSEIPNQKSLP